MPDPTICHKCGQAIAIGAFPFCPHGSGRSGVIDDTIPGGARWVHNIADEPLWISTKTEYKRELEKRGLVMAERGTYNRNDKSPYATRTRLRPGARDPFVQHG